jgi:hypothetical protein
MFEKTNGLPTEAPRGAKVGAGEGSVKMVWRKTLDGSIEDDTGRVIFFSKDRFVNDICLGRCCFICGAQPGSKIFNDEHVFPEWLLRKFSLFDRTITLPNGRTLRYDRNKIPCCQECNSLMGDQIESRISKVLDGGPEAVQKHVTDGNSLEFFVWMGLIFLKTHLKDRDLRVSPDLREPDEKIADSYDWQTLHHVHSVVRCFVNGATVERDVFGSFAVFAAKTQGTPDQFDFADLYHAQTMLLRMGDVALVTTFNDSCGAIQGAMPRLDRIEGPLSEIQAREVMVDFAFLALHLKERPKFFTECDMLREEVIEKAIWPAPGSVDTRLS